MQDIEIPLTQLERMTIQELAEEAGISLEKMTKILIDEGMTERLRTSQKIGSKTQVIDFKGPQNVLKRGER